MKKLLIFLLFLIVPTLCSGQGQQHDRIQLNAGAAIVQNYTAGGTITAGHLIKLNASAQAIESVTTDTAGIIGIAEGSAVLNGTVSVGFLGQVTITADGACTIGNYITISSTTNGNAHCQALAPTAQFLGVSLTTIGSAGNITGQVNVGNDGSNAAGATGANTALSNLAAVAINATLLPTSAGAQNIGTAPLPFGDVFIGGSANKSLDFNVAGLTANRQVTFPDSAGTISLLGFAQTWPGVQTYNAGSLLLNPGPLTFASAASAARTVTFPDNTGTVGEINLAQTWSATQTYNASASLDLSATTTTSGLKLPSLAGAIPVNDSFLAFNTTTHAPAWGSNGTTIVPAASGTGTTASTTCTNQVFTVISATAAPTCTTLTSAFLPAATVYNNAVNTGTAAMTLNMAASTTANALVAPAQAGLTAGTNGALAYDTTAGNTHIRTNAADSIAVGEAAALTTNAIPKATDSTHGLITGSLETDSGTQMNYTGTGGYLSNPASVAGSFSMKQGTAVSTGTTAITHQAPTAVTSYVLTEPGAAPTNNNSAMLFSNASPSVGSFAKMPRTGIMTAAQGGLASLTNLANLSFTVEASTNYVMTCTLYYQVSATTANLSIAITGPSTPTGLAYSLFDANTGAQIGDAAVATVFATTLAGAGTSTATTNFPAIVTMGLVNGGNAGTVQVQAGASGTGSSTIQTGSWCQIQ